MKYEAYADVDSDVNNGIFEFLSVGHNGNILKRVEFVPTQWPSTYNLGRLYTMAITLHLEELLKMFEIVAYVTGQKECSVSKRVECQSFFD